MHKLYHYNKSSSSYQKKKALCALAVLFFFVLKERKHNQHLTVRLNEHRKKTAAVQCHYQSMIHGLCIK